MERLAGTFESRPFKQVYAVRYGGRSLHMHDRAPVFLLPV